MVILVIDGTLQRSIYFNINSGNPVLAAPVQLGACNVGVPARMIRSPAWASQDAGVCITEASSDLVRWIAIQTNDLPRASLLNASDAALVTARSYRAVIR